MKLVEPWQCVTPGSSRRPVCSSTFLTASGWSSTARLVERPRVVRHVHARAPGLHPDVVAVVDERLDERARRRRAPDLRAHPDAVDEQHRPLRRRLRARDVDDVARDPVGGVERERPRRCARRRSSRQSSFAPGRRPPTGRRRTAPPKRPSASTRCGGIDAERRASGRRSPPGRTCRMPVATISRPRRRPRRRASTWPGEDVREERRRVAPDVEAAVVLDLLEAVERDRVALAVLDAAAGTS